MLSEEQVRSALKNVVDPEISFNIVDLGLVYSIEISGSRVFVRMTLTSPACPVGPQILEQARHEISCLTGVSDVEIELTFDPPWGIEKASPEIKALFEQQM